MERNVVKLIIIKFLRNKELSHHGMLAGKRIRVLASGGSKMGYPADIVNAMPKTEGLPLLTPWERLRLALSALLDRGRGPRKKRRIDQPKLYGQGIEKGAKPLERGEFNGVPESF